MTGGPVPRTSPGEPAAAESPVLTEWEIASGVIVGEVPPVVDLDAGGNAGDPLTALETACLPALQASPCLLSFSGGMDSTLVLAAALRVARREGLPDPVPVTWRFPDVPATDETEWQDRILDRLGVRNRHVITGKDELNLVGPVATRLLRTIGSYYPPNLHLHLPIADLASGGSILTGLGGDQVFVGARATTRPSAPPRAPWLPDPLRRRLRRQVGRDPYPWLSIPMSRAAERAEHAERAGGYATVGLADRVGRELRRRYLALTLGDTARMGAATGVTIVHPLLDPAFLRSVLATFGAGEPPPRAGMFQVIAKGCDPVVWTERPKARFSDVFLTDTARRYAADCAGRLEQAHLPAVVNPRALAAAWTTGPFPPPSVLLLQRCRLADPRD